MHSVIVGVLEHTRVRRILIVDDEPAIRKLLALVFTRAGYEVRVAAHGGEAIGICDAESFDVLLSDVRMPGMNGHELVRSVVRRYPKTRFVLMSAYDDIKCEGCGVASRPCTQLTKPFNPNEAVSLVDRILAQLPPPLIPLS